MARKIVATGGYEPDDPLAWMDNIVDDEPEEPFDSEDDDEDCDPDDPELLKRRDDIDQATSDYIMELMGLSDYGGSLEDLGFDISTLRDIEDTIEETLFEGFGITIYHPQIITDPYGHKIIVGSVYDQ